jgi:hypothetical protein
MRSRPRKTLDQMIELCVANLRTRFPNSAATRRLNEKLKVKAMNGGRCQIRAWVYPAMANGKCRLHLIDAAAESSTLPSALGFVVTSLHGPSFHPDAPSR